MNRMLLLLACCLMAGHLFGQDTTLPSRGARNPEAPSAAVAGPLLNTEQLERQKWYYSLQEAMREPEKVYKLSLRGEDLSFFPLEVTRFPNLQVLNLSANKIRVIPPAISELNNLQVLILANNKIKYLPDAMGEMENLEQLYLAGNKLVMVPAWEGGLSKLRRLDLTYNRLTQYEIDLIQQRLPRCQVSH